jgi:large subunit ribosomal protein L25
MAEVKLVAEPREGTGKGRRPQAAGRRPRARGAVRARDGLDRRLGGREGPVPRPAHGAGTNVLVDLVVDGTEHLIIPRDVQRDHIHGRFIHVDFLAVRRDEKLHLSIPSASSVSPPA